MTLTRAATLVNDPFWAMSIDDKAIGCFDALELQYWNQWENACRFQNDVLQNETMHRISILQDMKMEFKRDILNR